MCVRSGKILANEQLDNCPWRVWSVKCCPFQALLSSKAESTFCLLSKGIPSSAPPVVVSRYPPPVAALELAARRLRLNSPFPKRPPLPRVVLDSLL